MVRRSSSQPIKFMVIDDSRVIREQIEHILRGENYRFVGASADGLSAIREFKTWRPQIITMDLTMPKVDGAETIRRIMTMDSSVRILVVSALKDKATALKALRMGAYGFVPKPFTGKQLASAVNKLVNTLGS